MYVNVCNNIIHSSPKVETTQMSNFGMNTLAFLYCGTLLSNSTGINFKIIMLSERSQTKDNIRFYLYEIPEKANL